MTWAPTAPVGLIPIKSQAFNLNVGTAGDLAADGGDMVYKWRINGRPGAFGNAGAPVLTSTPAGPMTNWPAPGAPGSSFIFPFTANDIIIRKAQILRLPPAPGAAPPAISFLMIGNNAWGDPVAYLTNDKLMVTEDFPEGGMFFPGWASAGATGMAYMDLHGGAAAGSIPNVMVTFWFSDCPP